MIAADVSRYLASLGHGTEGTDLFIDYQPPSPDDCMVIYDESAVALAESAAYKVDAWGVQILVRAAVLDDARTKAVDVHKALLGFGGQRLAGAGPVIDMIEPVAVPNYIGRDEQRRSEVSSHYLVRAESSGDLHRS